ncbi:MAG: hypothetical protein WCL06_04045 [Bacteroidota bacterium]
MKTKLFVLIPLLICSYVLQAEILSLSLFEAIQKKMVKVDIRGLGYSSENSHGHYGKCITMNITNLVSQALQLNVETGRRLTCVYDSIQDMMVAKNEMFALGPNGSSDFTISAFCTQKHDRSPSETSHFTLDGMSEGYLHELSLLIESLGCFDNTGQNAVWVLTDSISPDQISGEDAAKVKKLKEFVVYAVSHMKEEKTVGFIYDYSFPDKTEKGFTLKGEINWDMPYSGLVSLTIYDNHNQKVKVLFDERLYKSGFQTFDYNLADLKLKENELYWLRVDGCGKRLKEVAVKMD